MKFQVWHVKREYTRDSFCEIPQQFPEKFDLVAVVEAKDHDAAYEKTQHIDQAWDLNPGVECIVKSRSSSVGDVFVPEGKHPCRVAAWGWELI
jgi:hypothetical protein